MDLKPKKRISLKVASQMTGYHPDYLSQLIRLGQLNGEKIGRNWFTTESALKKHIQKKKPANNLVTGGIFILVLCAIVAGFWISVVYQNTTSANTATSTTVRDSSNSGSITVSP
jgi:hypothetical protein